MREADRIATYFAPLSQGEAGSFSLTDDAAILVPPPHRKLVVTTDSVIAGTHVPHGATGAEVARKLVRRNLSDLAAMGASSWRYTLNLHTTTEVKPAWFADFASALAEEQATFQMTLIGGDSTFGAPPLMASMTCLGLIEGAALLRSNARVGDVVYVSGTIGDAALGLAVLQQKLAVREEDRAFLTARYDAPSPRLALGQALGGLAHAAMDISDGLLADALKLARASNVNIMIEREAVPLSDAARSCVQTDPLLWGKVLAGGDDYELLFSAPWSATERIQTLAQRLALKITRIGSITKGEGVTLRDALGHSIPIARYGYDHSES